MQLRSLLVVILFCFCITLQASTSLKLFTEGSYTRILEQHKGQAFVMVLWSVECVPCLTELTMLGQLKQRHPKLKLILISIDAPDVEHEIQTLLVKNNLAQASNWVFAEGVVQRLRFEVDPAWYGEVPRSYLFSVGHNRQAVTGELKREQIDTWLKSATS